MIFQCVAVVLCYFASELESKFIAPRIFEENDAVINTKDNLTLSCEGMEPLTWTVVNYKQINYNKTLVIRNVVNTKDSKLLYVSILRIENVSYLNTGFFYCHGIKASKDDIDRSSNIYVYVRDENRLCIVPPEELASYRVTPGAELIIPCLPTSPDITVELLSTNGEKDNSRYGRWSKKVDLKDTYFDPRTGFKIKMFNWDQNLFCLFTRNNQNQTIKIFLDYIGLPEIKTSLVYDPSGTNIVYVGSELELFCSIIVPHNSFFTFIWTLNYTKIREDSRISITNNPLIPISSGRLLTSTLKINNVTRKNEGEYHCCSFISSAGDLFASTYITVKDIATTIVSPKINHNGSEIIIHAQDNLTLECEGSESINWYFDDYINFNAYGKINFYMYKLRKFDKNVNINAYQVSDFLYKAVLTITNASIYNVRSLVCRPEHVKNDHSLRSTKIFIYVQDENYLSKYIGDYSDRKLVIFNTVSNLPCIPSSPDVNVSLIDANGNKVNSEIASFSPKLGFSFFGKDRGLRKYTCLYQRGNLTEEFLIDVLVLHDSEYDKTSFIEGPDNAIISVGQHLQLNCSMIIYNSVPYSQHDLFLNWTVPELLTAENELVIEDEESYPLTGGRVLIKRLTVKNVNLRTEGDYECILYDSLLNRLNYISKYITFLGPIDAELLIRIPKRKYIVTGENLILNCSVKVNNNVKFSLYWTFNNKSVKITTRIRTTNLKINQDISGVIGNTLLIVKNVTLAESGIYKCIIRNDLNSSKHIEENITIYEPNSPNSPNISDTNLNNTEWKLQEGKDIDLHCLSTGIPIPTTTWLKNDRPWIIDRNQNRITMNDDHTRVKFLYTQIADAGKYTCRVTNVAGEVENKILLTILAVPAKWTKIQITFIVILSILLAILVPILITKIIKEKKRKREFKIAGLNHFEEGAVENINPNLRIDSQAELLPYDKAFEIPREKLKLGKQLGSGFFGIVIQAEAFGIFPEEFKKIVAVKMVKGAADYMHIKALLAELKIMIHLGKHLNVVNLLGACTRNISKRELLVVVEYCRYGNIQNFLLKQRSSFINQIDRKTDSINISIGEEIFKQFEKYNVNNVDLKPPTCYYNVKPDAIYANISTSQTEKSISCIRPTCTHDLLCWSFQISQGMEYLTSRKVLHGDLAARNILLAEDNIVKICDFGLAKKIYNYYKKKTDGPLPVKWMAPESITDKIFSTQSDVWSFGIVLWELFSLARTPYPEIEANQDFYDKLLSGYRMSQPKYSTNEIYQIMLSCWKAIPSDRPSFNTLSNKIGTMLTERVQKYYADLNQHYANLNIARFKNQRDFLGMMQQPDYNTLTSILNMPETIVDNSENNDNVNSTNNSNEIKGIVLYSTLDLQSNMSEEDNSVNDISDNSENKDNANSTNGSNENKGIVI